MILIVVLILICFEKNPFEVEQKKVNIKDLIILMESSFDSAENNLRVLNYFHMPTPDSSFWLFVKDDYEGLSDSTDKAISLGLKGNQITTLKYLSSRSDLTNIYNEAIKYGGKLDKKSNLIFFKDYVIIKLDGPYEYDPSIQIWKSKDFWELYKTLKKE